MRSAPVPAMPSTAEVKALCMDAKGAPGVPARRRTGPTLDHAGAQPVAAQDLALDHAGVPARRRTGRTLNHAGAPARRRTAPTLNHAGGPARRRTAPTLDHAGVPARRRKGLPSITLGYELDEMTPRLSFGLLAV